MARLNLLLFAALILCALSLVNSQHQSRKLFAALEEQNEKTKQLDIEYGQLQLEQSTWAMHARIEKIAAQQLRMKAPEARRIQVVPPRQTESPRPDEAAKGAAK
jgi:cell division protein FtsL